LTGTSIQARPPRKPAKRTKRRKTDPVRAWVSRLNRYRPNLVDDTLAALRRIFEERGDYSLEFLGYLPPADALAWLTSVPGIGRKTASVVLMFAFGMPLMPVDRHVERVSIRIGLIPPKKTAEQAHDYLQALLTDEQVHEAHVNLITHGRQTCHAQRPACGRCAIAPRCRWFTPHAP
jgi:endonuclease III